MRQPFIIEKWTLLARVALGCLKGRTLFLRRFFSHRGLSDQPHQCVRRRAVAGGKGPKGVGVAEGFARGSARASVWRESACLVGVEGIRLPVDQSIGGAVAEVQSLILDPANVGEANADFPGQLLASLLRLVETPEISPFPDSPLQMIGKYSGLW